MITFKTFLSEATRKSTPKHEVVHASSGTVAVTDVSKTDARKIAKEMGDRFYVRPVKKKENG